MELRDVDEDFDGKKRSRLENPEEISSTYSGNGNLSAFVAHPRTSRQTHLFRDEPDEKADRNDSIPSYLASGTDEAEQIEDDFN